MRKIQSLFATALFLGLSANVFAADQAQEERIIQSVPQRQAQYHDPRVVSPEATNKRVTQKAAFIMREMRKKKLKDEAEMARIPSRGTLLPADTDGARLEMAKNKKLEKGYR